MVEKKRCTWCNMKNPTYVAYHDSEWGRPNFEDAYLYEMLILESFQSGLSWECVLNKREAFRRAYDNFDYNKVCAFDDARVAELLQNQAIIRNKLKIKASIANSRVFRDIVSEFGSFFSYLVSFTGEGICFETGKTKNEWSDALSLDLQKRGMKFVGSVTIYSYLQAIGKINSHEKDCFLHRK